MRVAARREGRDDCRSMTVPPDIVAKAAALGVAFDEGDLDRLDAFLRFLLETSEKFNLTAIRDEAEAWERHILDSLTLLPLLASAEAKTVADVGSGGGLPAIPLAICMPEVRFTLIESTGKKGNFLRECARRLRLTNVEVATERAETLGADPKLMREKFDAVTARAVGPLPVLLELTVPLARVRGLIFAIKGAKAEEELAVAKSALHLLHAAHVQTVPTPTGRVVVIEKLRKTPRTYPRRTGEPKRAPL